jgi:serine protease Do
MEYRALRTKESNAMHARNSPKDAYKTFSRRRLALLASVATIAGAMLLAGPGGNWRLNGTALVSPAQAAESTGPAGFADLVKKVKPAVVSVRVRLKNKSSSDDNQLQLPKGSPFDRFFRNFGMPNPNGPGFEKFTLALGSAFFVSPDGYAVTNNHVVKNAQSVEITTDDGKTYTAKVIGTDPKTDLALIKVDGRNDFPYVKFADTEPRVGDWIVAVGNPYGLGGTVTAGIVSARGRDIGAGPYDDFIQIDAPVNKGNSGGPAFDESGNVVGVTTAIFSPSGGSIGIGFAIPAETVKSVVAQLKDHGSVTRGWIGVQIQTVTQDIADSLGLKKAEGALVAEPQVGGPAAKAGIVSGDLIQSVNGQEVKDSRDLAQKIGSIKPGSTVQLGLLRSGSQKTISMTVEKMPNEAVAENQPGGGSSEGAATLGLTLAPAVAVPGEGSRGVVVTNVNPDGPAAERGVRSGDLILDVAGKAVNAPSDVRQALHEARSEGKHTVLMRIKSGDSTHFVALPVGTG